MYDPKAKIRATQLRHRRVELINRLKDKPCADCGILYPPCVMEFDHVRGKKLRSISWMIFHNTSYVQLMDELEKCELVCANCHRIRTWVKSEV